MDTSGAVSEWLQHKLNKFDVNDITLRTFLATCMELAHAESRTEIVAALEDAKADLASFFALVKESVESYKQKVEAAFANEALCPHVRTPFLSPCSASAVFFLALFVV
jgi:hypothetical protein